MGLAGSFGSFGSQNHVCENCGHSMALYSPNCPVCLSEKVTRPKKLTNVGATNSGIGQSVDHSSEIKKGNPMVALGVGAIFVALFVGAYTVFAPPQPVSVQKADPTPRAEPSPVRHASRPVRRSSSPPVVRQPPRVRSAATASAGPSPRRAAPMKLWESTQDSE